jgi:hypothetical protein
VERYVRSRASPVEVRPLLHPHSHLPSQHWNAHLPSQMGGFFFYELFAIAALDGFDYFWRLDADMVPRLDLA